MNLCIRYTWWGYLLIYTHELFTYITECFRHRQRHADTHARIHTIYISYLLVHSEVQHSVNVFYIREQLYKSFKNKSLLPSLKQASTKVFVIVSYWNQGATKVCVTYHGLNLLTASSISWRISSTKEKLKLVQFWTNTLT